jgi:hypothetical protein
MGRPISQQPQNLLSVLVAVPIGLAVALPYRRPQALQANSTGLQQSLFYVSGLRKKDKTYIGILLVVLRPKSSKRVCQNKK